MSREPSHICRNCLGKVINPETVTPGSFGLELVLWLLFIVPGILYSVWRISARKKVCPACGSTDLVPLGTPAGRLLLKERAAADIAAPAPPPAQSNGSGYRVGRAVGGIFHRGENL